MLRVSNRHQLWICVVTMMMTFSADLVAVQSLHRVQREASDAAQILNSKQRSIVVETHNKLRAQEGAANMELLAWNKTLAETAKTWADQCKFGHGYPPLDPADNKTTWYGQNIFYTTSSKVPGMETVVNNWYGEKRGYNFETKKCSIPPCGHYTQVVWAKARQIGCAYKYCDPLEGFMLGGKKLDRGTHVICNYVPPGNVQGQKPFKKGAACSKCRSGVGWCKDGLCNSACTSAGKDCSCAVHCFNCAKVNLKTCGCNCADGWYGAFCTDLCKDKGDCTDMNSYCGKDGWVKKNCHATCGVCKADPNAKAGQCPPAYGPGASPSPATTTSPSTASTITQPQMLLLLTTTTTTMMMMI